ncbi:MAG TPA: Calx-beta domain-containing protein, partial [Chthoniobacterales bacterium]|nr:Calx-beta domain-containing protein [Chthoniobacterales bacterium]
NTGFDIYSPIAGVNRAFAMIMPNAIFSILYDVNLVSGAVTFDGIVGASSPGIALVRALAAAPVGTLQFSAPSYSVGEAGSVATITINRVGGTEGTVSVMFTTSDGTATSGSDYTDSDQLVTFGPGVTTKTVTIPLNNDPDDENNETILLRLSDGTGGFAGVQSTATLTIVDDDIATPVIQGQSASTAALGETIAYVATITSNSITPLSGTLTFQLFGPNDTSCGAAPIFTSMVTVNGNGQYTSASFTPTTPGTYRWVVSYNGDVDHNAAVHTTCSSTPGQAFDATATVLGNIATRLRVETGDNVLIAGFIITGTQPKKVIVRGIGASLPLADKLADPTLELRDPIGLLLEANDNWVDSPNKQAIIDSTIPPSSNLESAIVATLQANNSNYTAILRGANSSTGIGVVEAYDLDRLVDSQLANISTRGFVSTGDNILIAGTIVVGKNPRKVIVRAIGPSLPLQGKIADPTLELRDGNGGLIEANDNWVDSPNKQAIIDSTIPPTNNLESAIVATLPGNTSAYTAIVRGVNGTTGIAVVEVYALSN